MRLQHTTLLLSDHFLKISALIIGCLLWSLFNESHRSHITLTIPLYTYNLPPSLRIEAPDALTVTLAGPRTALRKIDYAHLGAHIDVTTLHEGKNLLNLTTRDLLLPDDIILVKYTPMHLMLLS